MYNALEYQSETKVRQAQVVYLHEVLEKSYDEIADITHYAISTIKNYCKKFIELLNWAKEIFNKVNKRKSKYDEIIDSNGFDITTQKGEICYLFEFYNDDGELLCSKVGTTTRTIRQRLIEELRSKTYKEMGVTRAKVFRIYECGSLPAEGLESLIRSSYIKKYPTAFKKNDRFIKTKFDFDECDRVAMEYLGAS